MTPADPTTWSVLQADSALAQLLEATTTQESLIAARDREVSAVTSRYAEKLQAAGERIALLETQIEAYFRAQRDVVESANRKSIALTHGTIGVRSAGSPALLPLNEKWTWEKIERKVRRLFKARFFHKPKPPALDKVKLKRELVAAELETCGLKLEQSESFYIDLERAA